MLEFLILNIPLVKRMDTEGNNNNNNNNNNNLTLILRAFHEMIKRALHDFYR